MNVHVEMQNTRVRESAHDAHLKHVFPPNKVHYRLKVYPFYLFYHFITGRNEVGPR